MAPYDHRYFSAHEPDECRSRLVAATSYNPDPTELQLGLVPEPGWVPQLKQPKDSDGGSLRLRPPRKLGGLLTLATLSVGLRRDDAGGTIIEIKRRRQLWTLLAAIPPLLLALLLVGVAIGGRYWGVLVVAAAALALGIFVPFVLSGLGDVDAARLRGFVAETCDAVPFDDDETADSAG